MSTATAEGPATTAGPEGAAGKPSKKKFKEPTGFFTFEFALMAPALAFLALLSIVPLVMLIAMSFSKVRTLGGVRLTPNGVDNWAAVLSDASIWASWGRTLVYFVALIVLEMALGFAFAVVLNRLIRLRSVMLSIVLLPMFLAPVIVGLLGRFMLDGTIGLYAQMLSAVGLPVDLFAKPSTALPTIIMIDVWEWTPLIALIMLAGLTSVPPSTLEAASVDGAGYFRTLFTIMVPQMKGVMLVALLVRSMDAVRFYDIITATTNGGPADSTKIIPLKLYELAFRFNDQIGRAAVVGIMMLIFSNIIATLFVKLFADKEPTHAKLEGPGQ
ncbi:carbohydrate ABC transporter permease [Enemella evansiae]|uniref:carbohydrate ABC transporter permease n=1 Tax=Enemella evansiae TaxID=2016499 RepID=UPI001E30A7ED|nr:sugar ABC transporter permease [Enemella evansiae]